MCDAFSRIKICYRFSVTTCTINHSTVYQQFIVIRSKYLRGALTEHTVYDLIFVKE